MKYQEMLIKMGLNQKEADIYVALVQSGPSTISTLSKNTQLHRPVIYKTLPQLQAQGLVTSAPKGKLVYYVAESPEKLTLLLENTKTILQDTVIPELVGLFQSVSQKPIVKVLQGESGISFVFEDILNSLKKGEMYYRYSSVKDSVYDGTKYLPKDYAKRRKQKNIGRLVITSEKVSKRFGADMDREEKIIPAKYDTFDDNIAQYIYANKVAFVDYGSESALIIENPSMAQFQRKIFKLLYAKL